MQIENYIEKLIEDINGDGQLDLLKYVYNDESKFIPGESAVYYSGPYWDKREVIEAIKSLLIGKWISSGEQVKLFENKFCRIIKQRAGIMVNSGSSANLVMVAALKKTLEWEDGDEIIVSPVGFPTTIAPIVQNNLKPVFVDIELETLNFNVNKMEEKITRRTKAMFVSPVLGNPPDMEILQKLRDKYDLYLILDCCDSLGTTWNGKNLSEYSHSSSFSFYPAHHISTGEGGMITSNNYELIDVSRSLAWWGRDCYCVGKANMLPCGTCNKRFSPWLSDYDGIIDHKYVFNNIGYNLKPLDLQGAIGLIQLEKLDEVHSKRKRSRERISSLFEKYIDITVPTVYPQADVSWFGTAIICKSKEQKRSLVDYLEKNKVQTRNYFAGNLLIHPGYRHLDNFRNYPNANKVLDLVFFVGASPHYGDAVFNYIEGILKAYD